MASITSSRRHSPNDQDLTQSLNSPAELKVWTFNSSGWAGVRVALEAATEAGVPIVILQEHMVTKDLIAERDRSIRGKGWKTHWEPATRKGPKGGPNAGVMICVADHLGLRPVAVQHDDCTEGRLAAAMVDFATYSIGVATLYLYTGEGISTSNKVILAKAAQITETFQNEWILGGDLNFSPVTMLVSGCLPRAKEVGIVTKGPTYTLGKDQSNIDYFMMPIGPGKCQSIIDTQSGSR